MGQKQKTKTKQNIAYPHLKQENKQNQKHIHKKALPLEALQVWVYLLFTCPSKGGREESFDL